MTVTTGLPTLQCRQLSSLSRDNLSAAMGSSKLPTQATGPLSPQTRLLSTSERRQDGRPDHSAKLAGAAVAADELAAVECCWELQHRRLLRLDRHCGLAAVQI